MAEATVHVLPGVKRIVADDEPDEKCVGLLQSVLADALKGEVRAIAVAYVGRGDMVGSAWEETDKNHQLSAAIADLFYRNCAQRLRSVVEIDSNDDGDSA